MISEPEKFVKNSVTHTIGVIVELEDKCKKSWPELSHFLQKSTTSENQNDKEVNALINFTVTDSMWLFLNKKTYFFYLLKCILGIRNNFFYIFKSFPQALMLVFIDFFCMKFEQLKRELRFVWWLLNEFENRKPIQITKFTSICVIIVALFRFHSLILWIRVGNDLWMNDCK